MTPEEAVRAFFAVSSEGKPERFEAIVSGGVLAYGIDALVASGDSVAVAWTGNRPVTGRRRRRRPMTRPTTGAPLPFCPWWPDTTNRPLPPHAPDRAVPSGT